jgi:DNA-binding XRE family transcriptional regulator
MTHPGGRPTDYKPEMCNVVKELMRQGASKAEVAYELDVDRKTLSNWEKEHEQFFLAINKGVDMSEGWWTKSGRINLTNKDFNSRLWEINMMNRFGWMKKAHNNVDVEVSETERKIRKAEDQYK